MVTELRDISYTIECPTVIGLKDIDGDIATLLVDTLFAKASDEQASTTLPDTPVFTAQEKESTYWKRWMYFYLSATASPSMMRGWGELGGRVGNVRGGGTVNFFNQNGQGDPTWQVRHE